MGCHQEQKLYKPEDKEELERWLNSHITQWFIAEMMDQFDPHKRLLYADAAQQVGELKGEQTVMKYIRNPGELL